MPPFSGRCWGCPTRPSQFRLVDNRHRGGVLHLLGPIATCATVATANPSPSMDQVLEHEQRSSSVSLVLVVHAARFAGTHRKRLNGIRQNLSRRFVHADEHVLFVVFAVLPIENRLHASYESSTIGFGGAEAFVPPRSSGVRSWLDLKNSADWPAVNWAGWRVFR